MRIDCHTHVGFDPLFYLQGWSPYCLSLRHLFSDAEGAGIDAFVVFPFIAYMALDMDLLRQGRVGLPAGSADVPYRFENLRLYTDIQRCSEEERLRVWAFLIGDPSRKPAEQVSEWRNLPPDHSVHGIKFQTHTIQSPLLALLGEGAAMLDFAEERNLPVVMHTSVHPDDKWSQCSDALRVAASRPRVRFALAHSCRFHWDTLKRVADLPNAWFDCASFVMHCVCAQRDLPAVPPPAERFPSDYHCPETVLQDLASAFPDKLLWGSDSPYYGIEYDRLQIRSSYRREAACLDALPEPARERACWRNTLAWLGKG